MPKVSKGKPMSKLTHTQCRSKLCVVCFEPKKSLRDITGNSNFILVLKNNVGQNFDPSDPRIPSSLCDTCRKENFSQKAISDNKTFSIPQYLQFVVVPDNVDGPCECAICMKVRSGGSKTGLLQGKPVPHPGGRPVSSPNISTKQLKMSPNNLCSICLVPKGPEHNSKSCNEATKTKSILSLTHDEEGKPNKTGEKIAGKVLKGMDPSPNGTIRLSLPGTGKKLPVTKGAAKPKSTTMKIKARDLLKFQILNNLTDSTTKHLATFINKFIQTGTIEKGFQQKLREAYSKCDDFFDRELVEFIDEDTGKIKQFAFTHVKDLSTFLFFIMAQRRLEPQDTEAHLGLDKGGKLLKLTLTVLQQEEVQGEPLSSGVNKSFVVAVFADLQESHKSIMYMYKAVNAWETSHIQTNDLKVDNIMCGIQSHACSFPCYMCEAPKDKLLQKAKTRTIRDLFNDYKGYEEWCIGKSKTQQMQGGKLFHSVTKCPILAKGDEDDLDVPVRTRVALDELHTLTGSFQKLHQCCQNHFPSIKKWAKKSGAMQQGYHSGTFTGGDVKKMLENIGVLENMAREESSWTAMRFISAFRALNWVRKSCFSTKLGDDWSRALDEFQRQITDLVTDFEMDVSCTIKFHATIFHVREHLEDEIKLRPEAPRGLGSVSTQTAESMHHRFDKYVERFNPHWNCPELLVEEVFRATTSWAAKCLWPASDDGDAE